MRVLIFGATGMLGQALRKEAKTRNIDAIGVARTGADVCLDVCDGKLVISAIAQLKPDVVINAAAITNLSCCENDPGYAYRVNSRPVGLLAEVCRENDSYLIQISTDHYYTGDGNAKHQESHPVFLLNEYARTKYVAEKFAMTYDRSLIVRTNIVGFRGILACPTFVEWVINTLKDQSPITLFNDFFTSSIDVFHFSQLLFDLIGRYPTGIINLASREVANKESFIRKIAEKLGFTLEHAIIGSVNSNSTILRAESLGLDVMRAETIIGRRLPVLDEVIERLITEYSEGISG